MSKILPVFNSQTESLFYEATPKRKLFEMLREAASLLASLQIDGYEANDNPAIWMWQAENVGKEISEEALQ